MNKNNFVDIKKLLSEPLPSDISFESWNHKHPLAKLLSPMGMDFFLKNVWNKNFYHFPAEDHRRFSDNFPQKELLQSLPLADDERQLIVTLKSGANVQPCDFLAKAKSIINGKTKGSVGLASAHRFSVAVSRLNADFQNFTGFPCGTNSYFSAAGGVGVFGWHWDAHDVFVLQVRGSKKWTLFAPIVRLPLQDQNILLSEPNSMIKSQVLAEIVVNPGDLLYVPRGLPHRTQTLSGESSLHLTVGVYPMTPISVLNNLNELALEKLTEQVEFRKPLSQYDLSQVQLKKFMKNYHRELKKIEPIEALNFQIFKDNRLRPMLHLQIDSDRDLKILKKSRKKEMTILRTELPCRVLKIQKEFYLQTPDQKLRVPKSLLSAAKKQLTEGELLWTRGARSAAHWSLVHSFIKEMVQCRIVKLKQ